MSSDETGTGHDPRATARVFVDNSPTREVFGDDGPAPMTPEERAANQALIAEQIAHPWDPAADPWAPGDIRLALNDERVGPDVFDTDGRIDHARLAAHGLRLRGVDFEPIESH